MESTRFRSHVPEVRKASISSYFRLLRL